MLKRLTIVMCVCALGLVSPTTAWADDYTAVANGPWASGTTWGTAGPVPTSTADTATINTYKVSFLGANPFPTLGQLAIGGTGWLYIDRGDDTFFEYTVAGPIVMNGGTFEKQRRVRVNVDGTIGINGGTNTVIAGLDQAMFWNGALSSTTSDAKIVKYGGSLYGGGLVLNTANPDYSGQWQILEGYVRPMVDGALGTGTVTVGGPGSIYHGDWGDGDPIKYEAMAVLDMANIATNTGVGPAAINLGVNGMMYFNGGDPTLNWSNNPTITIDGGVIRGYGGNSINIPNPVYIGAQGATLLKTYPNMNFTGPVTGPGKVTMNLGTNGGEINFAGGNSYWGGTDITGCQNALVRIRAPGALGTGTVNVLTTGRLYSNPADNSQAVLSDLPIVVNGGALLYLNSTETAANITIKAGGGLSVAGGNTALTYGTGTTGMIHMYTGGILDQAIDGSSPQKAQPTPADITGGGQIFLGTPAGGAFTGTTFIVGPGGTNGVRGLSAMGGYATLTVGTTVQEDTVGSGLALNSPPGSTMWITGPTLNATGPVQLEGGGNFVLHATGAWGGSASAINVTGGSAILATRAGALNKTQTLNIEATGWFNGNYYGFADNGNDPGAFGESADPADFATVNVKSGGFFFDEVSTDGMARGNIIAQAGGQVSTNRQMAGGANYAFQHGSILGNWGNLPNHPAVSSGTVNFMVSGGGGWQDRQLGSTGANNIVLSDDTRLNFAYYINLLNTSGDITALGSQARVTVKTGYQAILSNKINLPGQTLVVGDTDTFHANTGWRANTWEDMGQAGQLYLRPNAVTNVIGNIDVQGGSLMIEAFDGRLGGAASIHTGPAGTAWISVGYNPALTASTPIFTGSGTINTYYDGGNRTLTIDSTTNMPLQPGAASAAGNLTLQGNLAFAAPSESGGSKLPIDIFTSSGGPGVGHDKLTVTGNATLTNGELVVAPAVPSGLLRPTTPNWSEPGTPVGFVTRDLGDMTILTAAGVTGQFAGTIVDANPKLAGFQTTGPWVLKSGAAMLDYASGNSVVLEGADIVWMALPGDANLDNAADVSDLSLLAGNFRKTTGQTWLQGDFNFDGAVDVSDLSLLAGRFRQTNPFFPAEGGSPVPEPMTMVLLGLGGLAVLARRRR